MTLSFIEENAMGRPAYQITTKDAPIVETYLRKHYGSDYPEVWHLDRKNFQTWCDDKLTTDQWKKLKSTILQERKRGRDYSAKTTPKTIQISPRAWKELNTLQCNLKDAGIDATYSDLIKAMAEKLNGKSGKQAARELEIQRDLI